MVEMALLLLVGIGALCGVLVALEAILLRIERWL